MATVIGLQEGLAAVGATQPSTDGISPVPAQQTTSETTINQTVQMQ
jgi:hypothetical protein